VNTSDILKMTQYFVLAVTFVPSALFTSKKALTWMQPREHRPLALFLVGVFFLVLGLVSVYVAFSGLHSGTEDCALRSCTSSYSLEQPFLYWTFVAMWCGSGVLLSGLGIAGFRKALGQP
jgi:hypothetical protein